MTHFAQSIEEVYDQLPLNITDTDNIIVTENIENVSKQSEFSVRPQIVHKALQWLIKNNSLYNNVKINENIKDTEFEIEKITHNLMNNKSFKNELQKPSIPNFKTIRSNVSILQGDFHQGYTLFNKSSGKQCTAMSAMAICVSNILNTSEWSPNIINQILFSGDKHYQKCLKNKDNQTGYLSSDEVIGEINFHDNIFQLTSQNDLDLLSTQPEVYSSTYKSNNKKNLKKILQIFIDSPSSNAIITSNGYSFALIKYNNEIYLFDSHSKGLKGNISSKGYASIFKYTGKFLN